MQSAKVCIFDLDGTILYTLDSIARAGNLTLAQLGFPPQPVDAYRYHCGDGSDTLVKRCLKAVGGFTDENWKKGCELNRKNIAANSVYNVKPYDGMTEALKELKDRGFKLAVLTNKPDDAAQTAVRDMYGDLFDLVRGQLPELPIKPDPAGALKIAEDLGVCPVDCAYFGDTWTDMQTGRAAGMFTVGVLWGYRDREELVNNGAEALIERPDEIPGLVRFCAD